MTYKPVHRDNKSRKEILANPETRAIYEATKLQIDLAMKLKKARLKRNLTQDDVAEIMHTKKPAISRLEAINDNVHHFPSLLTLIKFASAIGYELKFGLTPIKNLKKFKLENHREK
ncbi:MAG: helix-turn-helix transcriptional regulator [Gammaproteobacteria bacterium]|nr:helix-turn-helix transcriptional regulator [Gammaproteobacteria bacterium]